jgi:hypothetical protein
VQTISVNAIPVISVNSGAICAGQSFTMVPSGATTYTYSNGIDVVVPSGNESYTVTGAGANGCKNSAVSTVTVNPLPVISVNSGAICAGQSFTMVPTGATTYTYSNGSNIVIPSGNESYTVTGTDNNGCENSGISTLTVNAIPLISLGNDTAICQGNAIVLDAGAGFDNYSWNGGLASTQQYSVNQQGDYSVVVTNTNNCSNSDTIVLTVNQNPTIVFSAASDSLCSNGQAITFTTSPAGGTYSGNGINQLGVFEPQIANVGANTIYYELTNTSGCYGKDSALVEVLPKPIVIFSLGSPTLCINASTLALTNGLPVGGNYFGNGVVAGNAFDPAVSGSGNQIITYTYSDQYGCSDNAQDSVYVDLCTGFMAMQNSAIKVYPNPATDILHIDNLQSNSLISILDVTGKEIIKFSSDKLDTSISLTNLSSGLYFIKIQTMEKEILIHKILKN